MDDDVDDRYAGIDIDSLLSRNDTRRGLTYGRKKALYEAPEFLKRLYGEETIMEGQALCLECKIQGFPVPTLRWYKDDEEIVDHPRIKVESDGKGSYALLIDHVMRGDEAAYRCRAENVEGACSSVFFLSVRAKPKSARKDNQKSPNRRTVSFPPMFSTIVEKVEEEEKQGKELEMLPPSPLTDSYYALTLKSRATWPTFLGDWAFKNGAQISLKHRSNRRGSDDDGIPNGDVQGPQSPSEGRENARKTLRRSDLTARVHAKKQRLEEEKKQREEEAAKRKTDEKESEADRRKREEGEREKEEVRKKLEEKREDERKLETKLILEREERRRKRAELEKESAEKEEAMRKRREARAERIERERRVREEEEERWKKQQEEEENQRRLKAEKRQAEKELERAEAESLREKSLEKEQIEREEARRKEQEAKKKEEEKKKKEEEERKKYLEEKRKEEEKKKKEEEERKRLLEEKKKAEDKKRKDEEAKKKQLEEKKKEEEKKRKEEEEKKKQLEEKRKQDLKRKKQKEEEEQKRLAELKRKEEESKRKKEKEEEEGNKSNRTENGIDQKLQSLFGTYKTVNGERHTSHTDKNNQKVDTEANNLASKPKAFQMFQQKTEEKPDQAAPKRPKPGVLGRFQEKFESHPASSMSKTTEEASGKPGKFTLPGSSAQDKMAALQNKSGLARGVGEGSNSSAGSQDKHIPEQTVLKKVSPWHKRDTTGVSNDTQDKQGKHVKLEAAKRKEQEKLEHEKKKEEEKKLKEAKLKEQTKRKEEEKIKEETRKLEEKKRAEEKIKENKKKLGEQQKEKELKQKQEVEDKKRKEEEERRKKEEVIKSDLVRKQAAQREALEKRKKEEEAKLKAQLEKEEQEKMRLQFRKEQIRKEQLKRQRDEEIQKKQKKDKEEEEKRGRNKENMTATSPEDDDQVKVYKRDYSFSDLRKSLEATMTRGGAPVLDAEEHKYWDDILEKHNYSIGDIKKTLDTISSGSATLERPTRLRSRRNSIEDLEMVKMKRSSSISDLRESYTKSLERPKSKRKSSDTNKVKKDEEILKRTAKINETRQQLLDTVRKQLEPLTGGQSTREADITIRNLKTKTAETPTARSPVGGLPGNSIFLTQGTGSNPASVPHMDNLSISVKSKRASIHEMISHKPAAATPALRIASFSGKDVNKRKSYHGHDVHGSREIPVYRRAAGWDDNIGKSRDVSPQPLSCGSSGGSRGAVPSSTSSSSTSSSLTATTTDSKAGTTSRRPGKLTIPDKLGSEVRPFVFNSTRTIARRSTSSLNSDFSSDDDDDSVFDDGDDESIDESDNNKPSSTGNFYYPVKKTPLFHFDEDGDITTDDLTGETSHQASGTHSDLTNQLKRKGDNSSRTSSGYNTEEDRGEQARRSKIPRRESEKGGKSREALEQCGEDVGNNKRFKKNTATDTNTPSPTAHHTTSQAANGNITPPIVVEMWDNSMSGFAPCSDTITEENQKPRKRGDQPGGFLREEREPTPFMPGPTGNPISLHVRAGSSPAPPAHQPPVRTGSSLAPPAHQPPARAGSSLAPPAHQPPARLEREATPTPELGRKKYDLHLNSDPREQSFQREATPFFNDFGLSDREQDLTKRQQLTLEVPKLSTPSQPSGADLRSRQPGNTTTVAKDKLKEFSNISNLENPRDVFNHFVPQVMTEARMPLNYNSDEMSTFSKFKKSPESTGSSLLVTHDPPKSRSMPISPGGAGHTNRTTSPQRDKALGVNSEWSQTSVSTLPKDRPTTLLSHLEPTGTSFKSLQTHGVPFEKSSNLPCQENQKDYTSGINDKNDPIAVRVDSGKYSPLFLTPKQPILIDHSSNDQTGLGSAAQTNQNPTAHIREVDRNRKAAKISSSMKPEEVVDGSHLAISVPRQMSQPAQRVPSDKDLTLPQTSTSDNRLESTASQISTPTPQTNISLKKSVGSDSLPSHSVIVTTDPAHRRSRTPDKPRSRTPDKPAVIASRPPLDTTYHRLGPGPQRSSRLSGVGEQSLGQVFTNACPADIGDSSASESGNSRSARSSPARDSTSAPEADVNMKLSRGSPQDNEDVQTTSTTDNGSGSRVKDGLSQGWAVFMSVVEWIVLPPLPPYPDSTSTSTSPSTAPPGVHEDQSSSSETSAAPARNKKKVKLRAPRLSRRRQSRDKPSSGNRQRTGASFSQLTLRERLLECSPFGHYTSLAVLFILVMTFLCLTFKVPVGKFLCYVLACFYAFCVLRNIGVLD